MLDAALPHLEPAEGQEGLKKLLESFLKKVQDNPADNTHYVRYTLGDQKSILKVDMSKEPYEFYYNDLLGHPATLLVKNTIKAFLEAHGKTPTTLHDVHLLHVLRKAHDTEKALVNDLAENHTEAYKIAELDRYIKENAWANLPRSNISIGSHRSTIFAPKFEEKKDEAAPAPTPPKLGK